MSLKQSYNVKNTTDRLSLKAVYSLLIFNLPPIFVVPLQLGHNLGTHSGLVNILLPSNLRTKVNTLLKVRGVEWATAKTFEDIGNQRDIDAVNGLQNKRGDIIY